MRADRRTPDQLRPLGCDTEFNVYAEGSCIFEMGRTKVHCTATVTTEMPRWRRDSGLGWLNAEYRLLPRSTHHRSVREGRTDLKGRTAEIQRVVGRALRAAVDMKALGSFQIIVDCDVLQADGGTRTASVNGGYTAMVMALQSLVHARRIPALPLFWPIGAVSVGVVDGVPMLDLAYDEDSRAEVEMNVVMTGDGRFVEIQGTGEGRPFTEQEREAMLVLARKGIEEILAFQATILGRR